MWSSDGAPFAHPCRGCSKLCVSNKLSHFSPSVPLVIKLISPKMSPTYLETYATKIRELSRGACTGGTGVSFVGFISKASRYVLRYLLLVTLLLHDVDGVVTRHLMLRKLSCLS